MFYLIWFNHATYWHCLYVFLIYLLHYVASILLPLFITLVLVILILLNIPFDLIFETFGFDDDTLFSFDFVLLTSVGEWIIVTLSNVSFETVLWSTLWFGLQ